MTEYRIVTAKYDPSGVSVTDPIYKGNYGNILRLVDFPEGMIPDTFEMHFSVGGGNAKTQIGTNNDVLILDECLTKAVPITAWLFLHDAVTDGETKHEIRIPVKPKDNVTDAEPTPVEQSVITQAIAALNDGVTRSEAAQEAAEAAQEAAEGYAESAGNSAITATDAASAATSAQTAVETAARNAAASATDANASREAADQSATNAGTSERNAAASASAAQAAKEGAETAQSNAEASETSASESATDAAQSAGAAAQSATDAAGSASAAAGSASSASGSASSAAQSATDAAGSASTASGAASDATASASNAAASATAAAGSASQAAQTVAGIETTGAAQVQAVNNAGASQVQAVNNAGATQVGAVNAKGQEVLDSIPADYSELSGEVDTLMSAFTKHEQYAEETYAKQDGYYQDMAVGTAEQLVSSKFVEDQEPYTLRASGGSADIGNRENLTAIVGGTLAWNQQVRDEASENSTDFADVVTVTDAVEDNAGVKVKLEPVQDLHGYENPWPAGGGKNKCNAQNPIVIANEGNIGNTPCVIPTGTYTYSATTSANVAFRLSAWTSGGTSIGSWSSPTTVTGRHSITFTISEEAAYIRCYYNSATTISDIQVESGSTATSYTPYSNICPITGWDAVKVTRTGKNLLEVSQANEVRKNGGAYFTLDYLDDNSVRMNVSSVGAFYVIWEAFKVTRSLVGQYFTVSYGGDGFAYIYKTANKDGSWQANPISLLSNVRTVQITEDDIGRAFGIGFYNASGTNKTLSNVLVEFGSTASSYEAFQGQTYSISFPSEAGTVYGGELTVNEDGTGTLMVDRAMADLGTFNYTYQSANYRYYTDGIKSTVYKNGNTWSHPFICTAYKSMIWDSPVDQFITMDANGRVWIKDTRYSDTVSFKNALSGVMLCYKLAEPITYTLSAAQVQTILGTNNVWADAGQLSLTYTGTDEHLTLTDGRKYLTRINGTDAMVLGAGQALTAVKGRDNVFDLTQMFGTAAVADYVYGQGAGYFRKWFQNSLYAYNPGELKSVEGLQSHDTVGFNLWDEEWEVGSIASNGENASSSVNIRSKNFIPVLHGETYYYRTERTESGGYPIMYFYDSDKVLLTRFSVGKNTTFVVPDNVCFMRFFIQQNYGIVYQNDIAINLSNSGSRNGEYEPYEKHSYPLDSSLTLRGIPKAGSNGIYWDGDQYKPDGTVERRYGVVDLGSLNWYTSSPYKTASIPNPKLPATDNTVFNAITDSFNVVARNMTNNIGDIALSAAGILFVRANETPSGYLVYELATPTSETAEPYKELQQVDDWGTEEFVTTGLIPVGHETQYPANLRDKLQHLPDLASSNGIYIVKQTDSDMELMRLPDMPTENGNYRLKLNVASGSPTFSWEVVT